MRHETRLLQERRGRPTTAKRIDNVHGTKMRVD
jgi:hypothetical protein